MLHNNTISDFFDPSLDTELDVESNSSPRGSHKEHTEHGCFSLPYFASSLFATILEDTITELRIISECNNELRVQKTLVDEGFLKALKYSVEQPAVLDELGSIDPKRLTCDEYKLNKLDADRKYLDDVIMSTYLDMSLNKSFMALVDHVGKAMNRDNYREFMLEDEAKNRVTKRELHKQLRQQRNHIKSVTYDTDLIIDGLKRQIEDVALVAETRSRYINGWQRARTEQHTLTLAEKEAVPLDSSEYYKTRSDHEQRVHSEMELVIDIAINETLQKVEQWMEKYDTDMEAVDLKIQIMRNQHQDALKKRTGMEDTIEKHEKLIKEWIHFKDEREKARQYRDKMTKSAIMVQAWWRGMLVRRQLGPYKVKKKKGGDKDKKKK